jgi:FMN phosphatase YigB (HAD superfamily)
VGGDADMFRAGDLYPDAAPCLRRLRALGYRIGIAGNQPEDAAKVLESLDLGADFITSSAVLGVEKPAPLFFKQLAAKAGMEAGRIAYVG